MAEIRENSGEEAYAAEIERIRNQYYEEAKKKYGLDQVGNHLSNIIEDAADDVVRQVIPRSARKFLSAQGFNLVSHALTDGIITYTEIWKMSTSVANTLRPLAGNGLTWLVADVLNEYFKHHNLPIKASTKGKVKAQLKRALVSMDSEGKQLDLKPDMDIVVHEIRQKMGRGGKKKLEERNPFLIISCKTSLAERGMQTVRWKEYLQSLPEDVKRIKVFLVTIWETFEGDTQASRMSVLDGVYVAAEQISERGNIKQFNRIYEDVMRLYNEQPRDEIDLAGYFSDIKKD